MTPRERNLNGKKPIFEIKDRSELIEKYILKVRDAVWGLSGAMCHEEIPLKITVELYGNKIDFNHLTSEDYHKLIRSKKMINDRVENWYSTLN
jgi:hypothetical protein